MNYARTITLITSDSVEITYPLILLEQSCSTVADFVSESGLSESDNVGPMLLLDLNEVEVKSLLDFLVTHLYPTSREQLQSLCRAADYLDLKGLPMLGPSNPEAKEPNSPISLGDVIVRYDPNGPIYLGE